MTTPQYRVIGTRPPRYDVPDKLTGRALFGTDVSLPGMLYARFVRSPYAHARIRSIDTSRAEALPGVYAVVTAADLPRASDRVTSMGEAAINFKYLSDNILASDKVLYVGHAVAAVAATSVHIAEEAANLIQVDYEPLPPVLDVREAMRPDAPLLHETMRTRSLAKPSSTPSNIASHFQLLLGDPDKGFAEADVIVEREFTTATVHQGYIEPHAALALWNPDDSLTIWCSTQGSFGVRDQVAELLGIPLSKIRVIPTEVGGAFGGKATIYLEPVVAVLSRKAGRPVKAVMTRAEVFIGSGPSSGTYMRVKMGATRDGRLTAAEAEFCYEAGAYPGSPVGAASQSLGVYDIPNGRLDGYDVVLNKPKIGSYRAPGQTQATFAVETVIDELAEKLGMDPIEFRLKNTAKEGTRRIDGGRHGKIGGHEVLRAACDSAHYRSPLAGPYRGRGVAQGYWGNGAGTSSCNISVNEDGTLMLVTGSVDLSGTRTTIAMQALEVLGLPPDQISPSVGDTASIAYSEVSGGSRTTHATGIAAVEAAKDVIAQMCARAAKLWDVPVESVSYDKAKTLFTTSQDPSKQLSFKELAASLHRTGGPVTGVGNVDARGAGAAFGTHIVDVEVDPETGKVTILRYTVVQDVGKAIHPSYVEGQMQGGAAQGIGWALYEGYQYDDQGRMLNPNFLDYKMPTALDLPPIETIIVEVPNPRHPFGVRGVGENPIVPPPAAIANAIYRAIGKRLYTLPMTPARILEAIGVI